MCCKSGIWSLTIGSWFGSQISVHATFILPLLIEVFVSQVQFGDAKYTGLTLCVYCPVLFVSILLHGLAQLLVSRRFEGVSVIVLWPLGGVAMRDDAVGPAIEDFWVTVVGSLTHIPQALVWLVIMSALAKNGISHLKQETDVTALDSIPTWFAELARQASVLNMALFFLNFLVPAYPLNASHCLVALLVHFGQPIAKSASIVGYTGAVSGVAIIMFGTVEIAFYPNLHRQVIGPILIGAFILFSSGLLLFANYSEVINKHPLFSRDCYVDTIRRQRHDASADVPRHVACPDESSVDLESGRNLDEQSNPWNSIASVEEKSLMSYLGKGNRKLFETGNAASNEQQPFGSIESIESKPNSNLVEDQSTSRQNASQLQPKATGQ